MDQPGRLAHRLAGFFPFLRTRGLTIGLGEGLDLAGALDHVDSLQREDFHLACRTTLVKRPQDLPVFEEAFAEYWSMGGTGSHGDSEREPLLRPPVSPPPDNIQARWGTPAFRTGTGRLPEGKDLRLLVYSPDAPPGPRRAEFLKRSELDGMLRVARRFRRWAATIEGRRRVPSRVGAVDFPRTTRASLRFGGELLTVRRRRRKLQRTRLVILWDVSGSMEGHRPWLLGIVYALLRAIPATRLFAFSTDLQHLTGLLRGRPYRDVVRLVGERLERAGGGTQIGRCLATFQEDYGATIDPRTVVLILSDGWDVGNLELLEDRVASLRRRASLLLWVNPFAERPGFRPEVAGMKRAAPYVDLLVPPSALSEPEAYRRWFGYAPSQGPRRGAMSRSPSSPTQAPSG